VLDVAITDEAQAASYVRNIANPSSRPTLIYPSPVATAEVYLGTNTGGNGDRLRSIVQGAAGAQSFERTGWVKAVAGGEPDPGVLAALRSVWSTR
jgi:hypothetical protein